MVNVLWSARHIYGPDDCGPYFAADQETILPPWAGMASNACEVAEKIMEDYFDADAWLDHYGDDESADVSLTITSPGQLVGEYVVELRRIVTARARRNA